MSIAEQVARIKGEKSKIAIKLSTMGLAEQTATLATLATAIEGIDDKGAVTATVRQGESYTIPKGYHNGSGTVTGLDNPEADASKYMLQPKSVTPIKGQQSVSPDQGYYGLSSVTVDPIPAAYQDVTQVNATKDEVLSGKTIVAADGTIVVGEMPNKGKKVLFLGLADNNGNWIAKQAISKGYHDGTGYAYIDTQTPDPVTPDKTTQTISPDAGKVLKTVTVNPIPDAYQDVTGVTATAAEVLVGSKFVTADGTLTDGTMANRGELTRWLGRSSENSWIASQGIPEGYHDGTGKVYIDFEDTKEITPDKSTQTISPDVGKVLKNVTVNPIPDAYQDVSSVTATADQVLTGSTFVTADGTVTEGTMKKAQVSVVQINPLEETVHESICDAYVYQISVSLTADLENELAAI